MSEEEAALRARLAADALDVEAHVQLSKLLLKARPSRAQEAVSHLWPAVRGTPQEASGPLRFQLGLAVAVQGQHDVAEPLFQQVLELEPTFVEALLCLAATQEALGKREAAAATLGRAAELKPELKAFAEREAQRLQPPP